MSLYQYNCEQLCQLQRELEYKRAELDSASRDKQFEIDSISTDIRYARQRLEDLIKSLEGLKIEKDNIDRARADNQTKRDAVSNEKFRQNCSCW